MEEGYKANCFSNFNPVTTSFSFLSGTYIYENIIDSKVENPKLSPRMAIELWQSSLRIHRVWDWTRVQVATLEVLGNIH